MEQEQYVANIRKCRSWCIIVEAVCLYGDEEDMSFIILSLSLCLYEDRQRKEMSIESWIKTKKNSDQGVQFQVFPIFWAYSYFLLFLN